MHTSLSKHLHTEECNEISDQYKKCMKENKISRYTGVCTNFQIQLTKCLQNELVNNRKKGGEERRKKDLEYYIQNNPQLAEKVQLLEQLKKEKESAQNKNNGK